MTMHTISLEANMPFYDSHAVTQNDDFPFISEHWQPALWFPPIAKLQVQYPKADPYIIWLEAHFTSIPSLCPPLRLFQ